MWIGFALGACVPMVLGLVGMLRHYAYLASLDPNEAACGTGALGPLALIFLVAPSSGSVGAVIGWLAAKYP